MVKSWLPYIFTINSHRVGQFEDHGWIVGWLYLLKYSHGKNSTVKPFKQLGVAKSMIYQVLQNVDNRGATEKQLAYGWSIVRLTKRKREQDVNAAMDKSGVSQAKNAKKFGVYQIYVQRAFKWEGLKYYKRKLPKSSPEKAVDLRALLEAHDLDGCKAVSHCPGCNGWWVIFH